MELIAEGKPSVDAVLGSYYMSGLHSFVRGPTPVEFYGRDYARQIAPALFGASKSEAAASAPEAPMAPL